MSIHKKYKYLLVQKRGENVKNYFPKMSKIIFPVIIWTYDYRDGLDLHLEDFDTKKKTISGPHKKLGVKIPSEASIIKLKINFVTGIGCVFHFKIENYNNSALCWQQLPSLKTKTLKSYQMTF